MADPVKKVLAALLVSWVFLAFMPLVQADEIKSDDNTAAEIYKAGKELYDAGNYYEAAEEFERCLFYAKNPAIRANSLISRMFAYRMCKLYYREFLMIEELLDRFPEYVSCNELIEREFEIGKLFRSGVREPSFWFFRWVSFWQDVDRTEEVYTAALKRAPYSKSAPAAHMQLAIYYDLQGKARESLASLRAILDHHPKAPERKYALLALANGLYMLSGRGDGDSRYVNESVELFSKFCKEYPEAKEIEFARNTLAKARDVQAARLFEIAEFYRKNGRSEVAERYLAEIMTKYPESESAPQAEKNLVKVSDNYLPSVPQKPEPRLADLRSYKIPENAELLLISPEDKNSPYLLNVPDIKGEKLKEIKNNGEGKKK